MNADAKNEEKYSLTRHHINHAARISGAELHPCRKRQCMSPPRQRRSSPIPHTPRTSSNFGGARNLYVVILVDKVDVTDTTAVGGNEFLVASGSLITIVGGKHALKAHADALDCLYWRPTGGTQEVKADNAIAVDVGMHRDRAGCAGGGGTLDELDLGGF